MCDRRFAGLLASYLLSVPACHFLHPLPLSSLPVHRPSPPAGPGKNQEVLRRKIENGVKELWYFVRSEIKKLGQVESGVLQRHIDGLLQDLGHQQRSDADIPGEFGFFGCKHTTALLLGSYQKAETLYLSVLCNVLTGILLALIILLVSMMIHVCVCVRVCACVCVCVCVCACARVCFEYAIRKAMYSDPRRLPQPAPQCPGYGGLAKWRTAWRLLQNGGLQVRRSLVPTAVLFVCGN